MHLKELELSYFVKIRNKYFLTVELNIFKNTTQYIDCQVNHKD